MGEAAASVLRIAASASLALTLVSLLAVGASTAWPRVRRYLRTQRPSAGFVRVRR